MNDEINAALSLESTYLLTTTFFRNPNNPDKPWKPYKPQIQLYNYLDFGYDPLTSVLKPTSPPDMVVMWWPRQYGKCVVGETEIVLSDGTTKRVDQLTPTDTVLTHTLFSSAIALHGTHTAACVKLTTVEGRELVCTTDHPVLTPHGFKPAESLLRGETIYAYNGAITFDRVANVIPYGTHTVYDLEVLTDHTHITNGIITHNTEGVSSDIAARMIRFPNAQIGVMSNNQENAKKLIDRVYFFLRNSPFFDMVESKKTDSIRLSNGSSLFSFGQTENIRGNSLRWLYIDEAAQFPEDLIDGAALPTVRTAGAYNLYGTPSVVLLSTPRLKMTRFMEYYYKGLEYREIGCRKCGNKRPLTEFDVKFHPRELPQLPNCPVCGANDYEYVANRIATVTLDPFDHPTRTKEEILEELNRRGNTPLARCELLGEVTFDQAGVFSLSLLERNVDKRLTNTPNPNPNYRYVLATDFGKLHDATVIAIGHQSDDGTIYLDFMLHLPASGGMDYSEIRFHVMRYVAKFKPIWLILDANGIGSAVVEDIKYDLRDLRREGLSGFYEKNGGRIQYEFPPIPRLRTQIYNNKKNRLGFITEYAEKIDLIDNLNMLFVNDSIKIPPKFISRDITILWEELINFEYTYTTTNRIKYGTQRGHDDTVIALAMMAWGLRQRPYYYARPQLSERNYYASI